MVLYKCDTCDKVFNHKANFKRHQNRKNPCTKRVCEQHNKKEQHHINNNMNTLSTQPGHICEYCNKSYSRKYTLTRHQKDYCKDKLDQDNIINNLINKIIQLKEDNEEKDIVINKLVKDNTELKKQIKIITIQKNTYFRMSRLWLKKKYK